MIKKKSDNEQALDEFYQAMTGVKPLNTKHAKRALTPATPPAKKKKYKKPEISDVFNLNEAQDLPTLTKETVIKHKQSSLSNKILRNLQKGQYNVEAILDLHGMTIDQARSMVDRFIQQCLSDGTRVALIIHGKGHHSQMPILKNKLNHWLRQIDVILAFCSAAPRHGHRGAVYILLKNTLEES